MANIRAAERAAGTSTYQGSGVRTSHVHSGLEFQIPQDIQDALKGMSHASEPVLVIVVSTTLTQCSLIARLMRLLGYRYAE